MKKTLFFFLLVTGLCIMANAQKEQFLSGTHIISMRGKWKFKIDAAEEGIAMKWFDRELEDSIVLPGTMDEAGKGNKNQRREAGRLTRIFEYTGQAWYQQTVTIPPGWIGKHVTLLLERTKLATVWLDTLLIGSQNTLAGKQVYDLSNFITGGKHRITIMVDNKNRPPVGDPHQISDQTQTNWNGIIGRIELQAKDAMWMEDVQLYPDANNKTVKLRVQFGNRTRQEVKGNIIVNAKTWNVSRSIIVPAKSYTFQSGTAEYAEFIYPLGSQVQLWDEFSPALYKFTITFKSPEGYTDSKEINTGIRDFKTNKGQFVINGKTIFIRGKHDACVFPLTGYPPMTTEGWLKVFRIARSYGINLYRYHSWCPPEAAFRAADIIGMYMQPELPIWGSIGRQGEIKAGDVEQRIDNDPIAQRTAFLRTEGQNILKDFGNYSCFLMFALGNELTGSREVMGDMIAQYRAYDNRHLYAQGSNNFLNYPELSKGDDFWTTTLTGGHYSAGNYQPDTRGKDVRSSFPSDTIGHLNNVLAGTMYTYTSAIKDVPVPVIGHEIGQYQVYPHFTEIQKYKGVVQARNLEIFRDRLQKAGMGDQDEQFYKASGALAVLCYREEIETAIRTPGFGGFHLLDLQDFPGQGTALVGILDAFMDSKGLISPEEWRNFCNDIVPLVKMPSFVWVGNDSFSADAELAHYGAASFTAVPVWTVTDLKGSALFSGRLASTSFSQGKINALGKIQFRFPSVQKAQKLLLTLQVGKYKNVYPVWVYPEKEEIKTTGIVVTRKLNQQVLDTLSKGAKVIFFPEKEMIKKSIRGNFITDFWCYPMFKKYNPAGTMGILCDPKSDALAGFPTDFHSDWQWWRIVKNAPVIVLDTALVGYKPIIQVVDNFERNFKLSLLSECKVGKGSLLISGIPLPELNYPEAVTLYQSLLTYARSEKFSPLHTWSSSILESLFYFKN